MVKLFPATGSQKALFSGDSLTKLFKQFSHLTSLFSPFYKKLFIREDLDSSPSKGDQYPYPCQGPICQAKNQMKADTTCEQKRIFYSFLKTDVVRE